MLLTLLGLLFAALFSVFFGSEGEMDAQLFSLIFWGLIATGALGNVLLILYDFVKQRDTDWIRHIRLHHHGSGCASKASHST